jgi:6-phosphofructokinase
MILEAMGRNAGWLTLEGGIGGNADAILIPEINYNIDSVAKFLIKRFNEGHKSTVICVSEGAHERDKKQVAKIDERYPDSVKLGGIGALLARQLEDIIGNKTNPNVNPVFVPTARNHIGCVDDSRTFYSLCNLIKMQKHYPNNPTK